MTDADFLATAASALRWLWDAVSAALGVGVVLYATVPPIRRFVDARIAHYFDRQLEELKSELGLEAARVQAQHQRLLQNSAIVDPGAARPADVRRPREAEAHRCRRQREPQQPRTVAVHSRLLRLC